MQARINKFRNIKPLVKFENKILLIGVGIVGRSILPLVFKLIDIHPSQFTIIDMEDHRKSIRHYLKMGVKFIHKKITEQNYKTVLGSLLSEGDILLDLAYDIDTLCLLEYCHSNGIRFLNTSVEEWDPFDSTHKTPKQLTLYHRNEKIKKAVNKWEDHGVSGSTAILDCGANPGNVSCLVKQGMVDISRKILRNPKVSIERKKRIRRYIHNNYFNLLAREIGLKVVHISERDTQIINDPKKEGEFCNTWSPAGFIEESYATSEVGFGVHEKKLPENGKKHDSGSKNQIFLTEHAMNKQMRSYIHSGPIIGMLIRHGEAYSISDRLTVHKEDIPNPRSYIHDPLRHQIPMSKKLHSITSHYVYLPCDAGLASIHEYRMNGYKMQPKVRRLFNEIIDGRDELGGLLCWDGGLWWTGSKLDIHETRKMIDHTKNDINATSLQVGGSFIAALIYAIRHPSIGVCFTDDLDYAEYLSISNMFWGPMYSEEIKLPKEEFDKIKDFQFSQFEAKEKINLEQK